MISTNITEATNDDWIDFWESEDFRDIWNDMDNIEPLTPPRYFGCAVHGLAEALVAAVCAEVGGSSVPKRIDPLHCVSLRTLCPGQQESQFDLVLRNPATRLDPGPSLT